MLNILVEGQSNAVFFVPWGAPALQARAQALLGFDGRVDKVSIQGGIGCSTWGATALVPSPLNTPADTWLSGSARTGWQDGVLETKFVTCLHAWPVAVRAAPTVTLWLHNENDSRNEGVSQADWQSAIRYNVAAARAALRQDAASTPVDFVYVPFDFGTGMLQHNGHSAHVQALKAGFESLATDRAFNAVIAAQMGDADMDGPPGTRSPFGGPHFGSADMAQLAERVAVTVANQFWRMARPGAPAALARGTLDSTGPRILAAARLGARQLAVRFAWPTGLHGLQPLSAGASVGAGWCVVNDGAVMRAVAARLAGDGIVVNFPAPVPAAARLYYGYGDGRLFVGNGVGGPGRGMAVYDRAGMPVWGGAEGVGISK